MTYRERLTLSWWWILVIAGLILSVAVVYFVYQPPQVAGLLTLALVVLAAAATVAGATRISVDADGLHCGAHLLQSPYLGEVRALSAEQTRERLGPRADPRAFLLTRFYVSRAVEVTVEDPADPHPYWLVSTRRPEELADAIRRVRR